MNTIHFRRQCDERRPPLSAFPGNCGASTSGLRRKNETLATSDVKRPDIINLMYICMGKFVYKGNFELGVVVENRERSEGETKGVGRTS